MRDAPYPHAPRPGQWAHLSDEALAAELRKSSGRRPDHFEELLARHWQPVLDYARLCTVSAHAAGILAAAVFTRVFVDTLRRAGPSAAWRPELLVTVRDTATEWSGDARRRAALHPALRPRNPHAGMHLSTPANRRLAHRAFHRLPEPARCLLWHVEVEAERLEVPATLLGVAPETATAQWESCCTRFREACLAAHRELAPDDTCRRFTRLLDVSVHRGGTHLVPDLQRHTAACSHCHYAAEQLDHSGHRLGVLIAEAVLVWGARAYLRSRPGRRTKYESDVIGGSYGFPGPRHAAHRHRRPFGGFGADDTGSVPPLSA